MTDSDAGPEGLSEASAPGFPEAARAALALYAEANGRFEAFFARWTTGYCADCLALHRSANPDDPIGRHELTEGIFPGCCQEGVAEDPRVDDSSGVRLPPWLMAALIAARPVRPRGGGATYTVVDSSTGETHRGSGCRWMGEGGCSLGPLKSPICVFYLCAPVRAALAALAGAGEIAEADFLGYSSFLHHLCEVDPSSGEGLSGARGALRALMARVDEFERDLERGAADNSPPSKLLQKPS